MKLMRSRMISDVGTTRVPSFDGSRLQQGREAKGWSRGRLAAAVSKTVASVSGWERNVRTPEAATLVALAKALGLQPADLLSRPRPEWRMVEYRVVKGLQQMEVAEKTGMHPIRVSHVEQTYEKPSEEQFAALARVYDVPVQELQDAWDRTRDEFIGSESPEE
jgi:transcriptional regulator with XRE-family HTH domain